MVSQPTKDPPSILDYFPLAPVVQLQRLPSEHKVIPRRHLYIFAGLVKFNLGPFFHKEVEHPFVLRKVG